MSKGNCIDLSPRPARCRFFATSLFEQNGGVFSFLGEPVSTNLTLPSVQCLFMCIADNRMFVRTAVTFDAHCSVVAIARGTGLAANMPPKVKDKIVAFLEMMKHERLCLNCWMGPTEKFLDRTCCFRLVEQFMECQLTQPLLKDFSGPIQLFNSCRTDAAPLHCISRDCKCEDLAIADQIAEERLLRREATKRKHEDPEAA